MITGSYHYARVDLAATHSGADDANHYLERAGMYMKPGYLLPVFDLEGPNSLNAADLTAWSLDFINTINAAVGVNPIVYASSSYNNDEVTAAIAWNNSGTTPKTDPRTYQWVARPGGNGANGDPPPSTSPPGYPNPYGVWDPNYTNRTFSRDPAVKPWAFWQQTLDTTPAGLFKIDIDYANGNIEFVRDFLVPALWTAAGNGDWSQVANWNSNNAAYNGTIQSGPAPRLPNDQNLDWVKLQNANNATVTLSSGAQTVRKFYTQQPLNITGGSLTVGYLPGSGGKWDLPSEFADAVTISGGTYKAHTTQVDGNGGQFNINGGAVSFSAIDLASHSSNSGKIVMGGNATFTPYNNAGTSVIRSTGSLAQAGTFGLGSANRTLTVNDGSAAVDLSIKAAVTGAGGLVKSGVGTLQLAATNSFTGGTTINDGRLRITKESNLGSVTGGGIDSDNLTLNGGTLQTGSEITSVSLSNVGSGYTSFPTVNISGGGSDNSPAAVNILAGISSIAVTSGGSGYINQTSAPPVNGAGTFVDIIGGGGTGAAARAIVSGGVVTSIVITSSGSGYTSMPTIYISSTAQDIDASGTTQNVAGTGATATVNGITLQPTVTLTEPGFDYASPVITLTGGGGTGAVVSASSTPNMTLPATRGVLLGENGGTLSQTAGTMLTVQGVVSGTGELLKSGPGTLVLSGANSFSGPLRVNAGTLTAQGISGLGNASGDLIVENTNGGAGTNVVLNLSSTAPTTKGALSGSVAPAGSGTNTATINNGGQLFTINQTHDAAYQGTIAGAGGLTLGNASTSKLTLSGANTYTGTTTVLAGTLAYGASDVIATGDVTVSGPSAVLSMGNNFSDTVGTVTLDGGGTINNSALGTMTSTLTTSGSFEMKSGTATVILAGTTRVLNKTTGGTVTLSGLNTYGGGTTIAGGILNATTLADANAPSSIGLGSLVLNGGTLRYAGDAAQSTNRLITLGTGGGSIDSSSPTNAALDFTRTGAMAFTDIGSRLLMLAGTSTGNNVLAASIGNGPGNGSSTGGPTTIAKTGAGAWTLTGNNTHTGGVDVTGGTLLVAHPNALGTGALSVTNALAQLQPNLPSFASVGSVATSGAGQFDITDNTLLIRSSTGAAVRSLIVSGFASGAWNGPGISDSLAAVDFATGDKVLAIGFIDSAQLPAGTTTFAGITGLDDNDVILKHTYYGDADLGGTVDLDDFTQLLAGLAGDGTGWLYGDFDYNNTIDLDDFTQFLAGFNFNGAPLSSVEQMVLNANLTQAVETAMLSAIAAVPEPSGLAVLATAACGFAVRRRRNGSRKYPGV